MNKAIYFDIDGTIANLYGDPNWLPKLRAYDESPYRNAKPLINMSLFARLLHRAQRLGYTIGIISWLSKEPTPEYDQKVTDAKMAWLNEHLPSVQFDEIHIIAYGVPKSSVADSNGILFDDEEKNRQEWAKSNNGLAFSETAILEILRALW